MRSTELYMNFVPPRSPVLRRESLGPESEDFCISSNRPYWAFVRKEVKQSHIKVVLGMQGIY